MVIYFVTIATNYIEPPEAAHARIDDDRSDEVESEAGGKSTLDLSDQLRRCSVASTNAIRLSSVNVLHCYRH